MILMGTRYSPADPCIGQGSTSILPAAAIVAPPVKHWHDMKVLPLSGPLNPAAEPVKHVCQSHENWRVPHGAKSKCNATKSPIPDDMTANVENRGRGGAGR